MSGDKRLVLAPLLDLLNHRPSGVSNCRLCFELGPEVGVGLCFNPPSPNPNPNPNHPNPNHPSHPSHPNHPNQGGAEGGAVVVRTTAAVAAGDALTITYGAKPNAELLAAYGFALRHNPHERTLLHIPLAADDPLRAQKLGMLPGRMGRDGPAALCGSLGWAEAVGEVGGEEGGEAGDEASGEAGGEGVDFPPELLLLLGIVGATSVSELFSAMSGAAGPASWRLLARCCEAQAEQLVPHLVGAQDGQDGASAAGRAARVATEAQHALLTCAGRSARARLAAMLAAQADDMADE